MSAAVSRFAFLVTLRQGAVYYRQDRELTSAEPHYFLVVSPVRRDEPDIYFSVVTSQVEKRRVNARITGCREETLVDIPVGTHFQKQTLVFGK